MPDDPAWDRLGPPFQATIRMAERTGQITYSELDAVMPKGEYTSRQIESLLEYLALRGIEAVRAEGRAA